MIAYLKGKIKYITQGWIILDVNGVGYKVHINPNVNPPAGGRNPKQIQSPNDQKTKKVSNSDTEFYIYHHIREDRSELYGFETIEDLQAFELLLEVNGVGPKMAANILAKTTQNDLKQAIIKGDSGFFLSISGVGKKLAGKILLELKNKISGDEFNLADFNDESSEEIIGAMEGLGYTKKEIYPLLGKIPVELKKPEEKIKWLLKQTKK